MALALIYATLLAFIPYFVAVRFAPRLDWRRIRWFVLAVALVARGGTFITPTVLSDDVHRYLWEGKIQGAGFNPYQFAPDAPQLGQLRDANWQRVTHRDVPSAYQPLLLLLFRGAAVVATSPLVFRAIFTGFDLATFWLLVRLLRTRGQNESLALIWALNPLVILEFAGNGHEMSMAICFFVAGLLGLEGRKDGRMAPVWFAAAALSHLMALPVAAAAMVAARVRWQTWLTFAVLLGCGFVPFADAGRELVLGLEHIAGRWRFNGSVFEFLVRLVGHEDLHQGFGGVWIAYALPKRIVVVLLAVVFVWTVVRRYSPPHAALTLAGAMLLLSPTVHPWYVTWLVALACVEFRVAWLAFSALVVVSYVAKIVELQTGVWIDSSVVRWMEYAPLFGLLAWEWCRKRFDTTEQPR